MMWAIPTTTVAVLRADSYDEYTGDASNESYAATGVPASIIEQDRQVFDPASGAPRIIREARARLPRTTSVRESDRIRDENTGITYAIRSVRLVQSPIHLNDLTLELVRTQQIDP